MEEVILATLILGSLALVVVGLALVTLPGALIAAGVLLGALTVLYLKGTE